MVEHKWITVEERMPTMRLKKPIEDGQDYLESDFVLVWDGRKFDVAQAVSDITGLYWIDQYAGTAKAICWMPLPTPPEQPEGDEK